MRGVRLAVIGRDLDLQIRRARHNMLVGHDVAVAVDDEARAEALECLPNFTRTAAVIVAEKLRIEFFVGIADLPANDALGVDVYDRGQDFRDRDHGRLGRRISLTECAYAAKRERRENDPSAHERWK